MDDDYQYEAEKGCHNGGEKEIRNSAATHYTGQGDVKRTDRSYQGRNNEGNDQRLQHPQEEFSDNGDVHDLPLRPMLFQLMEHQAEADASQDTNCKL